MLGKQLTLYVGCDKHLLIEAKNTLVPRVIQHQCAK
jgi:hypothetical protein